MPGTVPRSVISCSLPCKSLSRGYRFVCVLYFCLSILKCSPSLSFSLDLENPQERNTACEQRSQQSPMLQHMPSDTERAWQEDLAQRLLFSSTRCDVISSSVCTFCHLIASESDCTAAKVWRHVVYFGRNLRLQQCSRWCRQSRCWHALEQ